jgi:hypothetical protein
MTYTVFNTFRPYSFGTDAIERQRVSLGQSIIDADFEYGLQATKWQTFQDIRKTPSMYEIPGTDYNLSSVVSDGSTPSLISAQMSSTTSTPQQIIQASNVIANQICLIATVAYASGIVTVTLSSAYPHGVLPGFTFPVTIVNVQTTAGAGSVNGQFIATATTNLQFTYPVAGVTTGSTFSVSALTFAYVGIQQTVPNQAASVAPGGTATIVTAIPHQITPGTTFQVQISGATGGTSGTINGTFTATASAYSAAGGFFANTFTFQALGTASGTFNGSSSTFLNTIGFVVGNQFGAPAGTANLPVAGYVQAMSNTYFINGLSSFITGPISNAYVIGSNVTVSFNTQSFLNPTIPGGTGINSTMGITSNLASNVFTLASAPVLNTSNTGVVNQYIIPTPTAHNIALGTSFPLTLQSVVNAGNSIGTINGTWTATALTANTFSIIVPGVNASFATSGYAYIPINQVLPLSGSNVYPGGFSSVTLAIPHNIPPGVPVQINNTGISGGLTGTLNGLFNATTYVPYLTTSPLQTTSMVALSTTVVQATFAAPHGLVPGQLITVYGSYASSGLPFNTTAGTPVVVASVPTSNALTYALTGLTQSATATTQGYVVNFGMTALTPSSMTFSGTQGSTTQTVIVTCTQPHGYSSTFYINVAGVVPAAFNTTAGTPVQVTVIDAWSFRYQTPGALTTGQVPATYIPMGCITPGLPAGSYTLSGTTVTAAFSAPGHGLVTGMLIQTSGFSSTGGTMNLPAVPITVTSATAFTFPSNATGTVTNSGSITVVSYAYNSFYFQNQATGVFNTSIGTTQLLNAFGFQSIPPPLTGATQYTANIYTFGATYSGLSTYIPGIPVLQGYSSNSATGYMTYPAQVFTSNTLVPVIGTSLVQNNATPLFSQKGTLLGTSNAYGTAVTTWSNTASNVLIWTSANFSQCAAPIPVNVSGITISTSNVATVTLGASPIPGISAGMTFMLAGATAPVGINGSYTITSVTGSPVTAFTFNTILQGTVTGTLTTGCQVSPVPALPITITNAVGGFGGGSMQAGGGLFGLNGGINGSWLAYPVSNAVSNVSLSGSSNVGIFQINTPTPVIQPYTTGNVYFGHLQTIPNALITTSGGVATVTTALPHFIPNGTMFPYQLTGTAVTSGNMNGSNVAISTSANTYTFFTSATQTSVISTTFFGSTKFLGTMGFTVDSPLTGFTANNYIVGGPVSNTASNIYTIQNFFTSNGVSASTLSVAALTGLATVTTAQPHGLSVGQYVSIQGSLMSIPNATSTTTGVTSAGTGVAYFTASASHSFVPGMMITVTGNNPTTLNTPATGAPILYVISATVFAYPTQGAVTATTSAAATAAIYGTGVATASRIMDISPVQITSLPATNQFTFNSGIFPQTALSLLGGNVPLILPASGCVSYLNNHNFIGGALLGGLPVSAYQGLSSNVINMTGLGNAARNYDRGEGYFLLNGIGTNGTFGYIAKGQVTPGIINTSYTVCRRGGIFNSGQARFQNVTLSQNGSASTANTVTISTSSPHGILPGTPITLIGWSNVFGVNGSFFAESVPTANTLTFTPTGAVGGTGAGSGLIGYGGSVYVQPYSYTVHRPFDGGVLLSVNQPVHGATAMRQSKKVFRYQSGKGLLWSTGTLFCPNNDIIVATSNGLASGSVISIVTDIQHGGPQSGASFLLKGITSNGYNGSFLVSNVINSTTLTVVSPTPTPVAGLGISSIAGNGQTATVTTSTNHNLQTGSYVQVQYTTSLLATPSAQTATSFPSGSLVTINLASTGTAISGLITNASTIGVTGTAVTMTILYATSTQIVTSVTSTGYFVITPVASGTSITGTTQTGTYTTNGTYTVNPSFISSNTLVLGLQSVGSLANSQTLTAPQLGQIGINTSGTGTLSSITSSNVVMTVSAAYTIQPNVYGTSITTNAGLGYLNGVYVPISVTAQARAGGVVYSTVTSGTVTGTYAQDYFASPYAMTNLGLSGTIGPATITNVTGAGTLTSPFVITSNAVQFTTSYVPSFATNSFTGGLGFNTGNALVPVVATGPTTFTYANGTNFASVSSPGGIVTSPGAYAITSFTSNATTATATTSNLHNFVSGTIATITGMTPPGYNGTYVISVVNSNTFQISTTLNQTATVLGTVTNAGTLQGTLVSVNISSIVGQTPTPTQATVTTVTPHGLATGTVVNIINPSVAGFATAAAGPAVITVTGQTTFVYTNSTSGTATVQGQVTTYIAQMSFQPRFVINGWQGASVRAGCFEDQNGWFWEFDGQTVWAVKRSSTGQMAGLCTVGTLSQTLNGDQNCRFLDQVRVDDKITIRGMTHTVTGIQSQNQLTFNPPFRGASSTVYNIKPCRIVESRIPQSQFNRDTVNGFGPSGFNFDLTKMQMLGIQYTWYGAGFSDFMIRGSDGNWVFAHRYVNNNVNDEAYMRTGNMPVRYEIINEASIATSTLAQTMYTNDKFFVINDNPQYWPPFGTVMIDQELVSYSSFSNTAPYTFTVVSRGTFLNYSVADTSRIFAGGAATDHPMITTNLGSVVGPSVYLVSCTCFPALNHWGSAFIMDGQFDSDRGYFFNYTFNSPSSIIAGQQPVPLFFIRLSPSASGGIVGDIGTRDLLNRAQLLLAKFDCSVVNTTVAGGTVNLQGILNPAGFDTANFSWQNINSGVQGGQPSFAQYAVFSQVTSGSYIQGSGERIFSLIAQSGGVSTIDLTSLKELSSTIICGNRFFPDGPDTLMITAQAYNQNITNLVTNLYWSEAQA